jgi:predicted AlkP superfamily pyrophosphatase or phosphodiesterase
MSMSLNLATVRGAETRRCGRCLVTLAILFVATAFKPGTRPERRSAILISWDGASGDHVRANLAAGTLPNLARLTRQGALVDMEVTGHGTDTKPGHAQMLTGYDPNLTTVYTNGRYRAIPRGFSIFERLHQAFGKDGLVTIMLTGKGPNLGSQVPDNGNAEPFSQARGNITVWDGDQIRPARIIGDRAIRYIDRYANKGRFFLFIHFPDVDVAGHTNGEDSSDYDRALADCDSWLGRIMEAVETQGALDRTLVYVTADHGFDKGTRRHANATRIFLGTNDPKVSVPGEQRDITPTILAAMGVDVTRLLPRLPGKVLTK